ncbi:hypothetical protein [Methanosarcina sp.]|uniref:hypothetical protein n=1 Tax=Methanosarcina sp. TaxID=2213 RepID=UPI003C708012
MSGIISAEIISFQKKMTSIILFQIILLGTSIAWSQLLVFPSLLGVDPWYHQNITLQIIQTHFIPSEFSYSKLPLFHLCIALTSIITDMDYKFATMLSVSFLQLVCNILLIFLLAKFTFNNTRVALYSSLLLALSNYHIRMSFWSIPNSLAPVFILMILYSLLKLRINHKLISVLISIILMISLVLTHSVTALYMAIILLIVWIFFYSYNLIYFNIHKPPFTFSYITLFVVFMFSWWTYASGHITTLASLIKFGFSMDIFIHTPAELIQQHINNVPLFERIFNFLGTLLYFTVSSVGCFYMISNRYGTKYSFCVLSAGITPLILNSFCSITSRNIISERWLFFSQIFLSIPLAVSILLCCNAVRHDNLKKTFLVSTTIILAFLLIVSLPANIDYDKFSSHSSMREALTTSELKAIKTTSSFWTGPIKTDNYYARSMSYNYDTYTFDNELFYSSTSSLQDYLILIRMDLISKPLKIFSSIYLPDHDYISELISELKIEKYSKIYSSGSVYGYLKH